MAKFTLKSNLSLDGVIYNAGEKVELTKEQSEQLAEIIENTQTIDTDEDETPKVKPAKKAEIVAALTEAGIDFDPNATRDELAELLANSKDLA